MLKPSINKWLLDTSFYPPYRPFNSTDDNMNVGVPPNLPIRLFCCHFDNGYHPTFCNKRDILICKVMMSHHICLCVALLTKEVLGEAHFLVSALHCFLCIWGWLVCLSFPIRQRYDWKDSILQKEGGATRKHCDSWATNTKMKACCCVYVCEDILVEGNLLYQSSMFPVLKWNNFCPI